MMANYYVEKRTKRRFFLGRKVHYYVVVVKYENGQPTDVYETSSHFDANVMVTCLGYMEKKDGNLA